MSSSYSKKYLLTYSVQMISILLGIVSLFVIVPYISDNKEIYGVYSLCLSTMVFLSYADLGFIEATMKYAAEYYQQNDRKREIEVLAFGGFVLFGIATVISLGYLVLSFHPEFVIKGIESSNQLGTARQLFLLMALFSPFIGLQRLAQCIFSIRIENYIFQFISILGSVSKILSVFVFFTFGRYEIVYYFAFIQIVPIICAIVSLFIAKHKYQYVLRYLFKSFRWNRKCFDATKDLAFSGFMMAISWILYYEIDQIAIAKLFGPEQVAIYAIGFALLNYIRMFLSGLFSPFTPRFAHFRASNDITGLSSFFEFVVSITTPIVLCPLVALCILVPQFITAWSGPSYVAAVPLATIFVILNIFASLNYTCGSIVAVFERTYTMKALALILPIIYWGGVFLLADSYAILSFGIMKVSVFWLTIIVYCVISFKVLSVNWSVFLRNIVKSNIAPLAVVLVFSVAMRCILHVEAKCFSMLLLVCFIILLVSFMGYLTSYLTNPMIKNCSRTIIGKLLNKIYKQRIIS